MAKSIFLVTLITNIYSSSKSKSSTNPIPGGVPQGSVLSPLLYSLYTHDFKPSIHSDVAFYADDSAFLSSGKVSNATIKQL